MLAKCQARTRVDLGMTTRHRPDADANLPEAVKEAFVDYVVDRLAREAPGTKLVIVDLLTDFARLHGVANLKAGRLKPIH